MSTETPTIEEPKKQIHPAIPAALVVLIVGLFVFFVIKPLFFPSRSNVVPPPVTSGGPSASPQPSPSPSPAAAPAETFEVFESKDPFRPLVVEFAAGAPGGTTSGTSTGSTGSTSTGGGAGGASAPTGGQSVTLVDVFTQDGTEKAQVKVGSTVFTVAAGEVFADNFKLLSISGTCATMLHGDDKFTLCEGEEVFK
ncbi:MAG TPA: hypothetical protein VI541_02080 [Actinomycetota bacterium]|nr:hypothetical protein [Actinomycetota bacterium]